MNLAGYGECSINTEVADKHRFEPHDLKFHKPNFVLSTHLKQQLTF